MLIDLHAHSSGISRCCRIPAEEVIERTLAAGLDGIVLCNHYMKSYVTDGDVNGFARRYTEEFRRAKAYGDSVACKVFFGVEVTMDKHNDAHILLYGIDEDFVLKNPCLFDLTQEELYALVKSVGGAVVQAHPYRQGKDLLDVRLLDGVEVNCHPGQRDSYVGDMIKIAKENSLILTCGGDYHADVPYRPRCGAYLPDSLKDGVEIGKHLISTPSLKLHIHESNTKKEYDYTYVRENA